ncbi:MAG: hypothetical protein C1943_17850 [Halochromatium sp.]|nr:hypothetical protein [Halochromatium sp.]
MINTSDPTTPAAETDLAEQMPAHPAPAVLDGLIDWSRLGPAAQSFTRAIADKPDLPIRLAKMALVFRTREMKADAKALAQAAMRLAPYDYPVRVLTDWLQRREAPALALSHRP